MSAAAKSSVTLGQRLTALWNSPTGPKTSHFWGPVANWGFVLAGLADLEKPPEKMSPNMTGAMCVYSALFMRFAWMVQPRNYLLLACHMCNESVQLYHLQRIVRYHNNKPEPQPLAPSPAVAAALAADKSK